MPEILVSVALVLEDYSLPDFIRPKGPIFHRWLPRGERDALTLPTKDPDMELQVWFERRGYVRNGFVRYDHERREVDEDIVARQAILDGGPLFGRLTISNITDDELESLEQEKVGSPHYVSLGKRVVQVLQPALSTIIELLTVNYGQYWIRNLDPWDSRRQSLGAYCRSQLQLSWSSDDGETWSPFRPEEPTTSLDAVLPSEDEFAEYLLPDDLGTIQTAVSAGYSPGLAESSLASAHRLFDQGQIRYAFVEAVTTAEIAVSDTVRTIASGSDELRDAMQSFHTLPIRAQLSILGSNSAEISSDDLENAISAIDIRNKIVHEGLDVHNSAQNSRLLLSLFSVVTTLFRAPEFKFPRLASGNRLYPDEDKEETSTS